MPLYEYRCTKCGHHIEVLQKFSDRPKRRCRECAGKLEKLISRTSFQLKGGGWYDQGYGSGSGGKGSSSSGSDSSGGSSSGSSSSGSSSSGSGSSKSDSTSGSSSDGKSDSGKNGSSGGSKSSAANA